MQFGTIEYMAWAKYNPVGRYNLARSGIPAVSPEEFGSTEGLDPAVSNDGGLPELLTAIASRYGVPQDHLISAQGTSAANFLAMAAVLQSGDEVLVEEPAYEPLRKIPIALGAELKRFPRRFEEGFRVDPFALRRGITSRTRLIVLTNLHNPTGVLVKPETLREVGAIAREAGARVLVDEVYLEFVCAEKPWTAASLGPEFIVTSSLTKVWGLSGLRCGWVVAEPEVIRRVEAVNDFIGVTGVAAGESLAARAFGRLGDFWQRTRRIIERNRPLVDAALTKEPALSLVAPSGGIVCFPRLNHVNDAGSFLRKIREEQDVSLVPGSFFEMPGHFRLGFGGPEDTLCEGLRRLSVALRSGG